MRAFQAMLALLMLVFGLAAFVSFFNQAFAGPRAWFASVALTVCFVVRRALDTMIARMEVDLDVV